MSPAPETTTTETNEDWEPIFKYEEPGTADDSLEAVARGDGVTITIEEPWAGSTETGFGAATSIRMDRTAARLLGEWLIQWASSAEGSNA